VDIMMDMLRSPAASLSQQALWCSHIMIVLRPQHGAVHF
jgi:hypothetical protein